MEDMQAPMLLTSQDCRDYDALVADFPGWQIGVTLQGWQAVPRPREQDRLTAPNADVLRAKLDCETALRKLLDP